MIEIRNYKTSDKASLAEIYLTSRQETFVWLPKSEFKLDDFDNDTKGETILIATLNSKNIGFVSIWTQDNFIHHLFVDPKSHGVGIGNRLLQEALKIVNKPARLKCVVQNSKACRFYEKNGWKVESTTIEGPMSPYHTYILE